MLIMQIKDILSEIERFAPLPYQENYDNSGVQVGNTAAEATGALLSLDVTEEVLDNSFAQALAGKISNECFEALDAPVKVIGSENLPAIPLNSTLEAAMIPNAEKVAKVMAELLKY